MGSKIMISETFTSHGVTCKFCKKPITIEVADSYAELGDPHKLIPIAACNRCADIREERRILEDKIRKLSMTFNSMKPDARKQETGRYRLAFDRLLKRYANLICRWHYLSGMTWDDAALDTIIEHPDHWQDVLKTLWTIFRDANRDRAERLKA
jgi:hypothetical protein